MIDRPYYAKVEREFAIISSYGIDNCSQKVAAKLIRRGKARKNEWVCKSCGKIRSENRRFAWVKNHKTKDGMWSLMGQCKKCSPKRRSRILYVPASEVDTIDVHSLSLIHI